MGTKRNRIITATVAALAACCATAYAATTMGDVVQRHNGQIYACYETDGTMHVQEVGDPDGYDTCPADQKLMTWNQRGMRGPTGAQGPAGPAYFIRTQVGDNGTDRHDSDTFTRSYSYTDGTTWVWTPWIKDVRKCAVTATPTSSKAGVTAVRQPVDYKDWVLVYTYQGTARTATNLDIVLACPNQNW